MGKTSVEKCHGELRTAILHSFLLFFALLCLYLSSTMMVKNRVTLLVHYFDNLAITNETAGQVTYRTMVKEILNAPYEIKPCSGRYIYVHDLPSRFNDGVVKNCSSLNKWFNMCFSLENFGLGPMVNKPERVLTKNSWYVTNQFMLEVIFRERMKKYECLTNDSSVASAIFVPFYAGLDIGRYLWGGYNPSIRDSNALELVKWLSRKPEWKKLWGRDHFFLGGRAAWDFHRLSDDDNDWGNKLMLLPESRNITMLTIETTSWSNEFGIPYPTYFHPATDREVLNWQKKMRRQKRRYLFAFAGVPRPNMKTSIRNQIMNQCLASRSKCNLLDCSQAGKCDNPVEVIKVFRSSVFCLQPPGDSPTRRSTFDSILAGCIPVFFHPGSAYAQYLWHFPRNYTKYSVFIPSDDVKNGRVMIKESLRRFSTDEVMAMREEVLRLIPRITYASFSLETTEDAFDITVKGVLDRVEDVRNRIEEGKDPGTSFAQENSWKLKLSGTGREDELMQFFS